MMPASLTPSHHSERGVWTTSVLLMPILLQLSVAERSGRAGTEARTADVGLPPTPPSTSSLSERTCCSSVTTNPIASRAFGKISLRLIASLGALSPLVVKDDDGWTPYTSAHRRSLENSTQLTRAKLRIGPSQMFFGQGMEMECYAGGPTLPQQRVRVGVRPVCGAGAAVAQFLVHVRCSLIPKYELSRWRRMNRASRQTAPFQRERGREHRELARDRRFLV